MWVIAATRYLFPKLGPFLEKREASGKEWRRLGKDIDRVHKAGTAAARKKDSVCHILLFQGHSRGRVACQPCFAFRNPAIKNKNPACLMTIKLRLCPPLLHLLYQDKMISYSYAVFLPDADARCCFFIRSADRSAPHIKSKITCLICKISLPNWPNKLGERLILRCPRRFFGQLGRTVNTRKSPEP